MRAWFHLFHLSLIGQGFVGLLVVVVVGGVCVFLLFFLFLSDRSSRSSCLIMTTLAQIRDCHSCNDERSMVQKKKFVVGCNWLVVVGWLLFVGCCWLVVVVWLLLVGSWWLVLGCLIPG